MNGFKLAHCVALIGMLLALSSGHAQTPPPTPTAAPAAAPDPTRVPAPASSMIPTQPVLPPVSTLAPPVPTSTDVVMQIEPEGRVFGQWLFQGRFAQESFRTFNPDYLIGVGDQIDLKLWGAYPFLARLEVDAQGNIFVPQVGPIAVANVRNAALNELVTGAVRRVYREDVGVYATLAAAQTVKVFVSGNVQRPGLYAASASDSLLHFLDRAGGVDLRAGSFLDVRVLRGDKLLRTVNLYDFLLQGRLPLLQLHDGDTIFVGPIRSTAEVSGLVAQPAQYEFKESMGLRELLQIAGISEQATHVRVTRTEAGQRESQYLPIGPEIASFDIHSGDEIEVVADRLTRSILVAVEGEHVGSAQVVLPYNATLADLLQRVQLSEQSQGAAIQLFRVSIAERQKQMLDEMLLKLEQAALTARSATREEATLRMQDSQMLLQFVQRARSIKPKGQLVIPRGVDPRTLALEDGDVLRIPRRSNIVAVHGEVFLPNSFVYREGDSVRDYINAAGGLSLNANDDRIVVLRQNGEVEISGTGGLFSGSARLDPGDEVLVLPQVDSKNFQLTKDIVEVLYQIAVAAGVVLRL